MSDEASRDPQTGRFKKGFSGNKGRRTKKPQTLLPHHWAEAVLDAAAHPVEITNRNGRVEKLPAYTVALRQLAGLSAQRDKNAMRQFVAAITEATKTMQAHKKRQFDRLGLYLQSVDEGRPWQLDDAEAAFYQDLAREAGMTISIEPFDPNKGANPVRPEDLEAVLADPAVARALRMSGGLDSGAIQTIIHRALRAYEAQRHKTLRQ